MRDIHKGGRPPVARPDGWAQMILSEYDRMTIKQMADYHRVSRTSINNWLKRARQEVADVHTESDQ